MSELYIFDRDDVLLTILSEDTGLIEAPIRDELNKVPDEPFIFTSESHVIYEQSYDKQGNLSKVSGSSVGTMDLLDSKKENVSPAQFIKVENRVVFKDRENKLREYVIKEIDEVDDLLTTETRATCIPAWIDELSEKVVLERVYSDAYIDRAVENALEDTRYEGRIIGDFGRASTSFFRESVVDCIWKIHEAWNVDISDNLVLDSMGRIDRRQIIFERINQYRNIRFDIDHNLHKVERTVLSYPVTAMYGWGASLETEGGGHSRYIDFSDVEWKKSNGDPVDKPKGQKWVGDPEALQLLGRPGKGKLHHREGIFSNQNYEDPEELLQATWQALQDNIKPEVNYKLSVEMIGEDVKLGYTVTAVDRNFANPVEVESRIIAIEYDLLDIDNTTEVELGDYIDLADNRIEDIEYDLNKRIDDVDDKANDAIESSDGKNTVYHGPDEPSNPNEGDIWFEVIDGTYVRTHRYDGSEWIVINDMDAREAENSAREARERADEAYNRAQDATEKAQEGFDKAQDAITSADNAFNRANEAFDSIEPLSEMVDENTGEISTIKQMAEGLQTRVGDAEGNITTLTQLADGLQSRVEDAEGNITTLQQTSESFATRIEDNEGNISTLTQTAEGLQTRMQDAEGNISTLTQTASSLVSKIDNMEIGGTNLNRDSNNFSPGVITTYDGSSLTGYEDNYEVEEWGAKDAHKMRFTAGDQTSSLKGLKNITSTTDTVEGRTYTVSLYVKNLRDHAMSININGLSPRPTVNLEPNESRRVVVTGKRSSSNLQLQFRSHHRGFFTEFAVWRAQVEEGNQVTDWSPSPEDMASKEQVFSQITQVYDAINLRVEKGDLINQINIDTSGVLISGKKLVLDGDTEVKGSFKVRDANIPNLSAGKITSGTLDAGRVTISGLLSSVRIRQTSGSNRIELREGRVWTYDNGGLTSTVSGRGHDFFRNGSMIGRIGSANWLNDPSYRGLLFNLDTTSDYMAWAFRRTSGSNPITMLSWHKSSGKDDKGFNFYDDIKIGTGYALRVRTLSTTGFTTADRLLTLENNQWDDVDGVYFRRPSGSKLFLSDTRAALINRGNAYIQVTQDSTGNRVESVSIYNRTYTSTSQQVRVTVNGVLGRSTSSRRYKLLEEPIELEYAKRILQLDAKTWYDKQSCEGYAHTLSTGEETDKEPIHRLGGLIAEDVHDAGLDLYVNYDDQNRPDGLAQNLWTLLLPIVKEHDSRIEQLEESHDSHYDYIKSLEKRIKELEESA